MSSNTLVISLLLGVAASSAACREARRRVSDLGNGVRRQGDAGLLRGPAAPDESVPTLTGRSRRPRGARRPSPRSAAHTAHAGAAVDTTASAKAE